MMSAWILALRMQRWRTKITESSQALRSQKPGKNARQRDRRSSTYRLAPPGRSMTSNHKKTVSRVAAELLDEAVFPIEIGLHRFCRGIRPLIRTPIAVWRVGFWQELWRACFQRTVVAAVEHMDVPSHLGKPGR